MHLSYTKEPQPMVVEIIRSPTFHWVPKISFDYVGYANQTKTITVAANS
jgi:hypothetical protein